MKNRSFLLTLVLSFVVTASGCLSGPPVAPDNDSGPVVGDAGPILTDSGHAGTDAGPSGYTWPTCSGRHVTRVRVLVTSSIANVSGALGACDSGWRPVALSPAGGSNVEGTSLSLDWSVPSSATGALRLGFRCGNSTSPEIWAHGLAAGRSATSLGVTVYETLEGAAEADMSAQVTTVAGGGENQLQAPLQENCTRP